MSWFIMVLVMFDVRQAFSASDPRLWPLAAASRWAFGGGQRPVGSLRLRRLLPGRHSTRRQQGRRGLQWRKRFSRQVPCQIDGPILRRTLAARAPLQHEFTLNSPCLIFMPELPEVEVTRRGVAPHLEGRIVEQVVLRREGLRWPFPARPAGAAGRAAHPAPAGAASTC
jgi:hypothetical protein